MDRVMELIQGAIRDLVFKSEDPPMEEMVPAVATDVSETESHPAFGQPEEDGGAKYADMEHQGLRPAPLLMDTWEDDLLATFSKRRQDADDKSSKDSVYTPTRLYHNPDAIIEILEGIHEQRNALLKILADAEETGEEPPLLLKEIVETIGVMLDDWADKLHESMEFEKELAKHEAKLQAAEAALNGGPD